MREYLQFRGEDVSPFLLHNLAYFNAKQPHKIACPVMLLAKRPTVEFGHRTLGMDVSGSYA